MLANRLLLTMRMGSKGNISPQVIEGYITVIILVVVLFLIIAALFPTLTSAGTSLNASGFPLGSMFVQGGAAWYILAAGVVILLIKSLFKKSK